MSKVVQVVLIVAFVLATGAVGIILYVRASINRLGFLAPSDVKVLISAANNARSAVVHSKACSFTIDQSGLGNEEQEAEMLYVAAMLDLYRAKFGVAAQRLSDIERLRDFDQSTNFDRRRLEKDCSVYFDRNGASVVSCGSSKPPSNELAKLIADAEYVQKFYRLGEIEVLYTPAPKC